MLLLVLGLAVASFCAQACSMPQPSVSECPQHHQSGTTNCCEHSSTNATITAKVDCTLGVKSTALIFVPVPYASISSLLHSGMDFHQRYGPPDSVLQSPILAPSSVLRV
jgi:hypothetical protein